MEPALQGLVNSSPPGKRLTCPLSLKHNNSSLKSTISHTFKQQAKEIHVTLQRKGTYTAEEGDVLRFEAEHKVTVGFGFRQGEHIRTFSFHSNRRVVCFAGNLVRWEILNKKGNGNAYFT